MAEPVISSQTTAETYTFQLTASESVQVFCDPPLGIREQVELNRSTGTGSSWTVNVRDAEGEALLTEGKNNAIISGPGYFQISKPVTDEATAVYLDE